MKPICKLTNKQNYHIVVDDVCKCLSKNNDPVKALDFLTCAAGQSLDKLLKICSNFIEIK